VRGGAMVGLGLINPFAALIPLIAPSNNKPLPCDTLFAQMHQHPVAPPPGQKMHALPKPDLGSVDAVKRALLKARIVAIPGSTSGIWLKTDLFPRLGVADALDVKMMPRGSDASALVAAGGAGIAVMPVSEILVAPGVDLAGALPLQIQMIQVFAAAAVAGASAMATARQLIAFLASPHAAEAIRRSGMEPVTAAR